MAGPALAGLFVALVGPWAAFALDASTLLVSVAWIVLSTTAVLAVRDVRDLRRKDVESVPEAEPVLPIA